MNHAIKKPNLPGFIGIDVIICALLDYMIKKLVSYGEEIKRNYGQKVGIWVSFPIVLMGGR